MTCSGVQQHAGHCLDVSAVRGSLPAVTQDIHCLMNCCLLGSVCTSADTKVTSCASSHKQLFPAKKMYCFGHNLFALQLSNASHASGILLKCTHVIAAPARVLCLLLAVLNHMCTNEHVDICLYACTCTGGTHDSCVLRADCLLHCLEHALLAMLPL